MLELCRCGHRWLLLFFPIQDLYTKLLGLDSHQYSLQAERKLQHQPFVSSHQKHLLSLDTRHQQS